MTNTELCSDPHCAAPGKYLTFAISGERYAFEVLKVQEIIKVPHITFVPRCPEFVRGVINLRGKIIPVTDLRLKFGISSAPFDERTCIVVISVIRGNQNLLVGVIVDTVLEVINFSSSEISLAPNYGRSLNADFVKGMANHDDTLNILIDIDRVMVSSGLAQCTQVIDSLQ